MKRPTCSPPGSETIDLDTLLPPFAPKGEAERWLFGLHRLGIRPGLTAVGELLERLGRPQDAFEAVVVAGTNGKGTASITLSELFRSSGLRTGLYTSPHLLDVRERIAVDGSPIPVADFDALVDEHRPLIEEVGTTFFESLTALTYLYFARQGVEIAVLEAGLGGRLDATNVSRKAAVLLTSVGMDHEELLGRSLEAIALEKLGLAESGVPFYLESLPEPLLGLARRHLDAVGAEALLVDDLHRGLCGATAGEGSVEARQFERLSALHADLAARRGWPRADAAAAWAQLRLPGRFDVRGLAPRLVLDTAHNAQALERLIGRWTGESSYDERVLVFATVHGKSIDSILPALAGAAATVVVTAPRWYRAVEPRNVAARLREAGASNVEVEEHTADALERARSIAGPGASILVTGSNFLVAEALDRLGIDDLSRTGPAPLWDRGLPLRRRTGRPGDDLVEDVA